MDANALNEWTEKVKCLLMAIHNYDNASLFSPTQWNNITLLNHFAVRADNLLKQLKALREDREPVAAVKELGDREG